MRIPETLLPEIQDLLATYRANQERLASQTVEMAPQNPLDLGTELTSQPITILPPMEASESLSLLNTNGIRAATTIIDPWYSPSPHKLDKRGRTALLKIIAQAAAVSEHVFVWGWPHEIAPLIERIPPSLKFVAWLTWHHKNVPSRVQGWRNCQQTCLHLSRPTSPLYPDNLRKKPEHALFRHGTDTVITEAALVGFIGKSEKVGHPAQKPESVFVPLILMTTQPDDLVIDITAGSGTTGSVARRLGRRSVLCDRSARYTMMMEDRLGLGRMTCFND